MYDLLKKVLLVTVVVGFTWETSESYHLDDMYDFTSEDVTLSRLGRSPQTDSSFRTKCKTPSQPPHGSWTYFNESLGELSSVVNAATTIIFSCDHGYKLSLTNDRRLYVVCLGNNMWTVPVMPTCERLCKPYYDTELIAYTCKMDDQLVPCDKATDSTVMTITCAPFYESAPGRPQRSTCVRGKWDYTLECVPVCGEKKLEHNTLIVGSHEADRGAYPWVTALYYRDNELAKFKFVCGGSLIALNIVLTAAHCVTKKDNGNIFPVQNFRVGAGKHYRQYQDTRDQDTAFYAEIEEIKPHKDYRGELQNFRGDIALLKLTRDFAATASIQPVCFVDPPPLKTNTLGLVTGWGFTTGSGNLSDKLKEVELPYNDAQECYDSFDSDFAKRYLISDKMCAGFNDQNTSVCNGDSGGGLMFRNPILNNKYFIYGIVSLSDTFIREQEQHCNIQRSALFTKVEIYLAWVQLEVQRWNPPLEFSPNCQTPPQPPNGRWTFQNNIVGEAKVPVPINTTILFACNEGYQLSSTTGKEQPVRCLDNNEWSVNQMPTCRAPWLTRKKCTQQVFPQHGKWAYIDDSAGNSNEALEASNVITFYCDKGYKLSLTNDNKHLVLCASDSKWTTTTPTNQKVCNTFYNNDLATYTCKTNDNLVSCDWAIHSSEVTHKCDPYYELIPEYSRASVCFDGTWNYLPKCVSCGEKKACPASPKVNGREVAKGHYPWSVVIYSNRVIAEFTNVCGGTLITTNIVLTAAHCVTTKEDGTKYPAEYFQVGAGKYYNTYQDIRDVGSAQYNEVEAIAVHKDYKGTIYNFQADIALLKTKGNFALTRTVQPICFQSLPPPEQITYGVVTGWGYSTQSREPSDKLQEIALLLNDDYECFQQLDPDVTQKYFKADKICARFSRKTTKVCKGDSGSGLVFKNPLYKNKYFIHGIVSIPPTYLINSTLQCNSQPSALFTKIESYLGWIQVQLRRWERKSQ